MIKRIVAALAALLALTACGPTGITPPAPAKAQNITAVVERSGPGGLSDVVVTTSLDAVESWSAVAQRWTAPFAWAPSQHMTIIVTANLAWTDAPPGFTLACWFEDRTGKLIEGSGHVAAVTHGLATVTCTYHGA